MHSETTYDVAIIGGGLAGLCLAIQSVKANLRVVVFEKEAYPFHKVCGEYISNESREFLKHVGVPISEMKLPEIDHLQISDAYGNAYGFPLGLGGFGVSRFLLDNTLYEKAKQRGVDFFTNTKVQNVDFKGQYFEVETNGSQFKSRVVAACYGKRSNLDIKWKRPFIEDNKGRQNNFIGVKYHVNYKQPTNLISLHNFKNGYCGISNIEESKCCLCYLTTSENLKRSNNSIKEMEEKILGKNPLLHNIFSTADFLFQDPVTISQINFDKKEQVVNHILMLGDAAGMITPLCGNGMSMAMHASKLAFQSIQQYFQSNLSREQMEADYCTKWDKQFSRRLLIGRNVQKLFGGNISTAIFLKTMHLFPSLSKGLINATHGKTF